MSRETYFNSGVATGLGGPLKWWGDEEHRSKPSSHIRAILLGNAIGRWTVSPVDQRDAAPSDIVYESVSADPFGDIDEKAFRLCQHVKDDQDASNLYRWAEQQIIEFRNDGRLLDEMDKPLIARKPVVHYMGEISATNHEMRFAVIATDRRPGEDVVEATLRWAKEMESRRMQ